MADAAAGPRAGTCELDVGGMDCSSCATTIERSLRALDGVRDVQVNVVGGKVRVGYVEGAVERGALTAAIRRAGFSVSDAVESRFTEVASSPALHASRWRRDGKLVMTVVAGTAFAAALLAGQIGAPRGVGVGLLVVSSIAGAWYVVPKGLKAARLLALDMNFLMALAALGAWLIGDAAEAAATLFLFGIAELLESYSMSRARGAIKALVALSPAEARVRRQGSDVNVPVADVHVGEVVIVRPGEKLPVDGIVESGRSSVNQAPITGESMPVDKEPGHEVFAGSLNSQGVLEIRSTRRATDSTLARIIHAVEEAQASRAPSQRFVDRFARVYTPIVVALAVAIALGPPLLGLGEWTTWIYRALTMLVVACPCALVISTPVTLVSGLTGAARAGILIKGGAALENLARVTVFAIDKTGTLTVGHPSVVDVVTAGSTAADEVVRLAAGVERHSEHPLARAILAHAVARNIVIPDSTEFESRVGRGAHASVDGAIVHIGNAQLANDLGLFGDAARGAVDVQERQGRSAVSVIVQREGGHALLGVIGIADEPRAEARTALAALRGAGVEHLVMLTGDNRGAADAVGQAVGIADVRATLLPHEKLRIVRELEAGGARVAFVGDGVNDAPALAAATVGIAMGAAGTDVAIETADVALMSDDLSKLAYAVRLSRKTLGIVRQNVAFALGIKAVFLVLAATGWATLWMAVAADMGGSLIVVANGLRARRA